MKTLKIFNCKRFRIILLSILVSFSTIYFSIMPALASTYYKTISPESYYALYAYLSSDEYWSINVNVMDYGKTIDVYVLDAFWYSKFQAGQSFYTELKYENQESITFYFYPNVADTYYIVFSNDNEFSSVYIYVDSNIYTKSSYTLDLFLFLLPIIIIIIIIVIIIIAVSQSRKSKTSITKYTQQPSVPQNSVTPSKTISAPLSQQPSLNQPKFCLYCGKENDIKARFCDECGSPLN